MPRPSRSHCRRCRDGTGKGRCPRGRTPAQARSLAALLAVARFAGPLAATWIQWGQGQACPRSVPPRRRGPVAAQAGESTTSGIDPRPRGSPRIGCAPGSPESSQARRPANDARGKTLSLECRVWLCSETPVENAPVMRGQRSKYTTCRSMAPSSLAEPARIEGLRGRGDGRCATVAGATAAQG